MRINPSSAFSRLPYSMTVVPQTRFGVLREKGELIPLGNAPSRGAFVFDTVGGKILGAIDVPGWFSPREPGDVPPEIWGRVTLEMVQRLFPDTNRIPTSVSTHLSNEVLEALLQ